MAFKEFRLDGLGTVRVYKRRANRNMRLSIDSAGNIRVTTPAWVPYATAISFVAARRDWITSHRSQPQTILLPGQKIGKAHHLRFITTSQSKAVTRIVGDEIRVMHPSGLDSFNQTIQSLAREASIRALKKQAEQLLPKRLAYLAEQGNFSYDHVTVKRLKSRWGSCDQDKNIVLNLFLMQLPWECIDYVLLHELTHTKVLHHGPEFWDELQKHQPDAKELKRKMRTYQPVLGTQNINPMQ